MRFLKHTIILLLFFIILLPSLALAEYWASKQSNKFHYPSCTHAKKIKPENKVIFETKETALKAGYSPCKVCKP